jgi:hypothetical protein
MLTPLKQFVCDTCGKIIEKPEHGWIEWVDDLDKRIDSFSNFHIVHHASYSPLKGYDGCYKNSLEKGRSDMHLHDFIDDNYKMANILSFLDVGSYHAPKYEKTKIADMRQYVEIVRRLTIPYYEEARLYWEKAKQDGYFEDKSEILIYAVNHLKELINEYAD